MDKYEAVRNLNPLTVLSALGVDISTFKKRNGKPEWAGKCPVHGSKNNSGCFSIHEDGRFSCFSCQAKGKGMVDLVKLVRQCNFTAAVEFLSPLVGQTPTPIEKAPPRGTGEATEAILKPFDGASYRKFAVESEWLNKRVDKRMQHTYEVFCYSNPARKSAYSGRVMIPIKSSDGVLYGYLGRDTSDTQHHPNGSEQSQTPKYLFPRDFPKNRFLFGAYELRQHLSGLGTGRSVYQHVYLLESQFAVIKFASLGLPAVSSFGWSVSEEQTSILQSLAKGVVWLPDSNKVQESRAYVANLATRLWIRFPPLPDQIQDPEQMTKEQILALTR